MSDLVIFDCDGVLIDSEWIALDLLRETLSANGLTLPVRDVQGIFQGRSQAAVDRIVRDRFRIDLPEATLSDMTTQALRLFESELTAIDGMADLVGRVDAAFCVASSSSLPRLTRSLEIVGLLPMFGNAIFGAEMVDLGKPAPDLFLLAAERMGAPADGCIVVEDSVAGIEAGRAAGMIVVGFTGGRHAASPDYGARLADAGAFQIASDADALALILQDLGCLGAPVS